MLVNFAQTIAPNVSPLDGNSIEDDEKVSYGIVTATRVSSQIESIDWSDSIIEKCRFESTTVLNSSFERVGIIDCDLSGVVFSNCLLRECLVMGVKAGSCLVFDNCIIDRLIIARSRCDSLELQQCQIAGIEFFGIESGQLKFHQCQAHKRKGQVSFQECEIAKVSGLESMGKNGVSLQVDAPMWRDLGDYYLKERGIQQINSTMVKDNRLLDEIGESIVRNR